MNTFVLLTFSLSVAMAQMAGGWSDTPPKPEHMDIAWKAVKGINDEASNNGPYYYVPIKVLKAKSQVVAGMNHELEVLVGESSCKKGDMQAHELTASNCQLKDNAGRALYKVKLWEKPWENFEQFNVEKIRNVEAHEQI